MDLIGFSLFGTDDFIQKIEFIEIRKIGNIFTLYDRKKDRDWQSDSKNLVVSKNRRSNHRGLTVQYINTEYTFNRALDK